MKLICKYSFIADDLIKPDFEKKPPSLNGVLPFKIYFFYQHIE